MGEIQKRAQQLDAQVHAMQIRSTATYVFLLHALLEFC